MEGQKYQVLKAIPGFTLASIRGEKGDGVYGRDRFYFHYEPIPEGELLELFGEIDLSAMNKLRASGHVRAIGRFVVPEGRVEIARTRHHI